MPSRNDVAGGVDHDGEGSVHPENTSAAYDTAPFFGATGSCQLEYDPVRSLFAAPSREPRRRERSGRHDIAPSIRCRSVGDAPPEAVSPADSTVFASKLDHGEPGTPREASEDSIALSVYYDPARFTEE